MTKAFQEPAYAWLALALLTLSACGDDGDGTESSPAAQNTEGAAETETPTADTDQVPGAEIFGPRHLVATGVLGPEDVSGLVVGLDDLGPGVTVDTSQALEIPGGAFVYAVPGTSHFITVGQSEPTLTQFTYNEDGSISQGPTMSLANFGVTPGIRTVRVLNGTQGWVSIRGQLFEFDPTQMTVSREIQLDGLDRQETSGPSDESTGNSFVRDGESVFFTYGYYRNEDPAVVAEAALVHVDLQTGAHEVSSITGCGDPADGFVDESGNLYLASWSYVVEARAWSPTESAASCLIAVPAGQTSLDAATVTDFETLSGRLAGGLLPLGSSQALVRVADDTLNTDVDTIDEVRSQAAWGWANLDLTTTTLTPRTDLPLSTASTGSFADGTDQIVAVTSADFSETLLYRANTQSATAGVAIPGFFINGVTR